MTSEVEHLMPTFVRSMTCQLRLCLQYGKTDKIKGTLNSNISKLKRIRKPVNKEVDQALLQWFKQKRIQNVPISRPILQERRRIFQDFVC